MDTFKDKISLDRMEARATAVVDLKASSARNRIAIAAGHAQLLRSGRRRALRVLAGAHCDDIEIGCGATLQCCRPASEAVIDWVVLSGTDERATRPGARCAQLVRPPSR
jgi:hypothetical protein